MKKVFILMMAAMPLLYSCNKNNESGPEEKPDEVPAEVKKLQTDVIGKWQFENISLEGGTAINARVITHSKRLKQLGIKRHSREGDIEMAGADDPVVLSDEHGYIEFLSDSTYLIFDSENNFFQGKFNALTGDSISLGKFGSIGGIKIANGNLNFTLYYSAQTKKVVISSVKQGLVLTNSLTPVLCRSWYLTTEGYGSEVIGDTDEVYNEQTQQYDEYVIDSVSFTITASGTYLIQDFNKGKLIYIDVDSWKWHSTKADTFVFYETGEDPDEDRDFLKITSLTSTSFKCSQFDDVDENGTVDELKLSFKPAK